MPLFDLAVVFAAAMLAGGINAIAGGGSLVTFPALVALGIPPLVANVTNAVALWPGSLGGWWAYRGELRGARSWVVRFTVPSVAGALTGAWLLLATGAERFDRIVPFLVLGATLLFMLQSQISAGRARRAALVGVPLPERPTATYLLWQFAVAVYGGYFGAGIGILMLAVLGAMGLQNIHRMNGLKNWAAFCINAVAAALFAVSGIVNWPVAAVMGAGGLCGGYSGAHVAQRVAEHWVRRVIIGIGLAAFTWLLVRTR